ncbi:hypothetical protein LTR97_011821 [Elasticomyces elasticus]|uniref:Uncharacterized protein n=1 Tax=Elasticomyces elasticus TaxID=574655 RepID=A0AAN7VWK6_9PEZI|nr:hypothetical protein LTR97_011821 [Elasticomyces elasticus]
MALNTNFKGMIRIFSAIKKSRDDRRKGDQPVLRFPNITPKDFNSYAQSLYADDIARETTLFPGFQSLVKLCVVAEYFQNRRVQEIATDQINNDMNRLNQIPGPDVVTYAYEKTSVGSTLRELLVSAYFHDDGVDWIEDIANMHPEFKDDLLTEMLRSRKISRNIKKEEDESAEGDV